MFRLLLMVLSLITEIIPASDPPKVDPIVEDPPTPPKNEKPEGITTEIQEFFNGIIAETTRKTKDAATKAAQDAVDATSKKAADAAKVNDEESKKNYDAAKLLIEADLTAKAAELEAATAQRDRLLKLVEADVEASWKDVPAEIKETFTGEESDVLAKKDFMTKMAKVIAKFTGVKDAKPGLKPDPVPNGNLKDETPAVLPKRSLFN